MLRRLVVPGKVTLIGDYAFALLEGLRTISLPASIVRIGSFAFDGCTQLEVVEIPSGTNEPGDCGGL